MHSHANHRFLLLLALGTGFLVSRIPATAQAPDALPPASNITSHHRDHHASAAVAASLLNALKDSNPGVRAAAARALGDLRVHVAVAALIPLLEDPDGFVRDAAAAALADLGDASAVPALIAKLQQESRTLSPPGPGADGLVVQSPTPALPEAARQQVVQQQVGSVRALGALRDSKAAEPLIRHALNSHEVSVQIAAALALSKIGGAPAAHALEQALAECNRALPNDDPLTPLIPSRPLPEPVRALQHQQVYLRNALVWSLGEIGESSSIPVLKQALTDPNSIVRDNAAEALDKIHRRRMD